MQERLRWLYGVMDLNGAENDSMHCSTIVPKGTMTSIRMM